MNEENTEVILEIPVSAEYVEPDETDNDALDETSGDAAASSDAVTDLESTEILEDSTEELLEDSTELTLEDIVQLLQQDDTAEVTATTAYDDSAVLAKLDKIHMDLMFIIFLLLVFWCSERIRNGTRNLLKWTK